CQEMASVPYDDFLLRAGAGLTPLLGAILRGGASPAAWAGIPFCAFSSAGANNLTGKTNDQIATLYVSLFKRTSAVYGPPKLDAQVLAVAPAVYVTNQNLAGATVAAYGFEVSTTGGLATSTYDVGDANRAAFGLSPTQLRS